MNVVEGMFDLREYPKESKIFEDFMKFVDRQPNKYIVTNYVDLENDDDKNSYCVVAITGKESISFYENLRKSGIING